MQYFNIQVVSQLSGVASATIRAWEKRYNAVAPKRGDNNHRLYSEKDIEKIILLHKLTLKGESIGRIAHLGSEELKNIYLSLYNSQYLSPFKNNKELEKMIRPEDFLNNFFISISNYKLDILSHELDKAKKALSPRDLCLKVIVPLFHEIGKRVAKNQITIAQEHTLSALFSFHIGQMIGAHYEKEPTNNDLVLITTPEGEIHELGILASSLLFVHYGIKFIFLGANLPAKSLIEAANALKPRAILLGIIKGHEISETKTLNDYLSEVIPKLNFKAEIWIGGNLRSYAAHDLDHQKIPYFPTLESFDEFLSHY